MANQPKNSIEIECPGVQHWNGRIKFKDGLKCKRAFDNLLDWGLPAHIREHHPTLTIRAELNNTDKIIPSAYVESYEKTVQL